MYVPSIPHLNMQFYDCPMGYCGCSHDASYGSHVCVYTYSHNNPDFQCKCDRKGAIIECTIMLSLYTTCSWINSLGILCGKCRDDGKGVSSLFNKCVTCSNTAVLLILALS